MFANQRAGDRTRTGDTNPGKVVLCQLSYIRKKVQGMPSASTEAALRQIVKKRPPRAVVRSIDRWSVPMRRPVEVRNEKGPDPFGIRASMGDRVAGAQCYARPVPGVR